MSRTGGLGDVALYLSKYLTKYAVNVNVFTYKYKNIPHDSLIDVGVSFVLSTRQGNINIKIWQAKIEGFNVFLLEDDKGISDEIYSGDELMQAVVLADGTFRAIESLVNAGIINRPAVMHCNDWQTTLVPVYLKTKYSNHPLFKNIASVFAIHNLAYQGENIIGSLARGLMS